MKRMLMITVAASVVSALVVAVAADQKPQASSSADDEAAIRRVIADQTAAFNRHEVDRTLFTDDADFVNAQGIWLQGASAIESGRRAQFQRALKAATIKVLDLRVRFLRPDVAIAHATYEISGMVGPDGLTMPSHRELGLRVLTKNNGRWLVTAFHITTVGSRQPSARQ